MDKFFTPTQNRHMTLSPSRKQLGFTTLGEGIYIPLLFLVLWIAGIVALWFFFPEWGLLYAIFISGIPASVLTFLLEPPLASAISRKKRPELTRLRLDPKLNAAIEKKPGATRLPLDPKLSAAIDAEIEARREIEQNVRFILAKLPTLDVPVEVKNQIERLCYEFYDALCGITPLPLEALDRLVRQLDVDPKLALASILITESGANILRVRAGLPTPPPALAERRFDCADCGRAAGVLRLLEDHSYERRSFTSNMTGGGALPPEEFEKLSRIIDTGDLDALYSHDPEMASFYCPVCRACYCQGHWNPWDVFDEDGWHDSIRGRCPKGHERKLED